MSRTTYYLRNRETILNRPNDCYANNKEVLKEGAKNMYRELFKKYKNIKRKHGRNSYHNMSEKKKQKLKEYQKIIQKLKSLNLVIKIFYGFNNVCFALFMHY